MKIPENFTPQEFYAAAWNAAIGNFTLELQQELTSRIRELQDYRTLHLNTINEYDDICENYTRQIEVLKELRKAIEALENSYYKNAEDFE